MPTSPIPAARSGAGWRTPVGWFPGKDGSWVIVASAAGGPKNPAWYHNLAAYPVIRLTPRPTTASA